MACQFVRLRGVPVRAPLCLAQRRLVGGTEGIDRSAGRPRLEDGSGALSLRGATKSRACSCALRDVFASFVAAVVDAHFFA